MATKWDLEAIGARCIEGTRLVTRKMPQTEIARQLGVSREAMSIWT